MSVVLEETMPIPVYLHNIDGIFGSGVLPNVISVVAIMVSLLVAFFSFRQAKKMSRIALEEAFHREIFFDFLTKQIPRAIENIPRNPRNMELYETSLGELEDVLDKLRQASKFYEFQNLDFYKRLGTQLRKLEEILHPKPSLTIQDRRALTQLNTSLQKEISELYKLVMTRYLGDNSS